MEIIRRNKRYIYKDKRGEIDVLLPEGVEIKNILNITGKKDAIRGNHWHKEDTHYCLITSGKIRYSWRKIDEVKFHNRTLVYGDIVYTPAEEVHRFEFITGGSFLAMATRSREQDTYENDTIRID